MGQSARGKGRERKGRAVGGTWSKGHFCPDFHTNTTPEISPAPKPGDCNKLSRSKRTAGRGGVLPTLSWTYQWFAVFQVLRFRAPLCNCCPFPRSPKSPLAQLAGSVATGLITPWQGRPGNCPSRLSPLSIPSWFCLSLSHTPNLSLHSSASHRSFQRVG